MGLFDVFRSAAGTIGDIAGGFFSTVGEAAGAIPGAIASVGAPLIGGIRAGFQPGPISQVQGPSRGGFGGFLEGAGGLIGEAAEQFLSGGREPIDFPTPMAPRHPGAVVDPRRGAGDLTVQSILEGRKQPGVGFTVIDMPRVGFDEPFSEGGMMAAPVALPGGALIGGLMRQIPGILGGAAGGALVAGSGGGDIELPYGGTIFNVTPTGLRAKSMVEIVNPMTGRKSWYRNVGRPILFSGDLRVCKRVDRVARRARSARRGR